MSLRFVKSLGQSCRAREVSLLTEITQGSGEHAKDDVSTLSKAEADPDSRQVSIETMAHENVNTGCKRVIRPLKAPSAPMDRG